MTLSEFKKIWLSLPEDEETRNYNPQDHDRFIDIGGYLFAVMESGNVVFKKVRKTNFTIRDVFRGFRLWCIKEKIKYIRVEGTKQRYLFLRKMFPQLSILKDEEIKERNVFYIKLFD